MSRPPTVKAGEPPTEEERGKAKTNPIRSVPGVRPPVPAVKPVSKPPPAQVPAAKPPPKIGASPSMKPPAVPKLPLGSARSQVPPTTPTQALRTPPTVKPSSKVNASPAPVGQSVKAPRQAAAQPSSTSGPGDDQASQALSTPTWPCGVPGMEEASRLLSGTGPQGEHDEGIDGLWKSLTEVELGSLLERPSALDLSALKEAVIVRWRLAHALETKPARGVPVDFGALEGLLKAADIALTKLQTPPEAATAAVRASFVSARAALAKNAVGLSNFAAEFAQQVAAEVATNKATKKYEKVARIAAVSANTTRTGLRSKLLWVGMALSVLGALAFHGFRYLHQKEAPVSGSSYSAAGMHGFQNESSGIAVLHPIDPSKPIDRAALAQLKAQAAAIGKTVHEVGPGQYVIAPSKLRVPGSSTTQSAAGR